jgi:hypothetical protein
MGRWLDQTSKPRFGPSDYPLLTNALDNYAAQQRYFADQLDPDDGQLDHARRILLQQTEAAADLSKRIDTAFMNRAEPTGGGWCGGAVAVGGNE